MSEQQRLSADGLYYWDGKQWVTTLSPDGRSRWDGSRWVPVQQLIAPPPVYRPIPMPYSAPRPPRVPTSWTKPLQYTVAAAFAVYGLYTLSVPLWLGSAMNDYARQTALRQAQQAPDLYPNPDQYANTMVGVVEFAVWIGVIIAVAIAAVVVVGALKRWTWMFYVVLALLALAVIGLPFSIANAAGITPQFGQLQPPAVTNWVSIAVGVAAIGLGAWILIALITRGPWAMRRPLPGGQ